MGHPVAMGDIPRFTGGSGFLVPHPPRPESELPAFSDLEEEEEEDLYGPEVREGDDSDDDNGGSLSSQTNVSFSLHSPIGDTHTNESTPSQPSHQPSEPSQHLMDDVLLEVKDFIRNPIADATKDGYRSHNKLYIVFCYQHDIEMLTDTSLEHIQTLLTSL